MNRSVCKAHERVTDVWPGIHTCSSWAHEGRQRRSAQGERAPRLGDCGAHDVQGCPHTRGDTLHTHTCARARTHTHTHTHGPERGGRQAHAGKREVNRNKTGLESHLEVEQPERPKGRENQSWRENTDTHREAHTQKEGDTHMGSHKDTEGREGTKWNRRGTVVRPGRGDDTTAETREFQRPGSEKAGNQCSV